MSVLKFTPICVVRVWGGRSLAKVFGRDLPEGKRIGETWEIVDRPESQSIVAEGPWKNRTLRELIESNSDWLLGPSWPSAKPFPILVKWLDCSERLSLQVHPPSVIAHELGGEPKTENWYVAEATSGAGLIAGLKSGVSRESFEEALNAGCLADLCHRFPSFAGDSLLVESGRIHAIDGGNLILEVQQNSDTTYRVYDWERLGLDGEPRELHIEESMRCINFNDFEPEPYRSDAEVAEQVIAECDHFRICKFELVDGQIKKLSSAGVDVALVHILSGSLHGEGCFLKAGDTGLVPFAENFLAQASKKTTLLLTDRFIG